MDNLKREIADQGMSGALDIYLQKKTADLENSKLLMKTAHVNKINNVYQNEMENTNKVVMKAAEILQHDFLLLRSMGELDNGMIEQLQGLGKLLQGERSVKFAESEVPTAPEATECLTFHNIMNLTDCASDEVHQSPMSAKKRLNSDDDDFENESKKSKNLAAGEDFQFLRPKALKSINFGASSSSDMNVTYDMNVAGPSGTKPVLSERSNRPATTNGVMKSK